MEREFVMIARSMGNEGNSDTVFEVFKKVVSKDPKIILNELSKTYPTGPSVKILFEQGESENVERIVGKSALLGMAENFRIDSTYIFGMNGEAQWLHLYTADKKLRDISQFNN